MNQEKQREAYEKMLKKCPDILTPMKANRWSPVGKNTIYAALKNGEIESYNRFCSIFCNKVFEK